MSFGIKSKKENLKGLSIEGYFYRQDGARCQKKLQQTEEILIST